MVAPRQAIRVNMLLFARWAEAAWDFGLDCYWPKGRRNSHSFNETEK